MQTAFISGQDDLPLKEARKIFGEEKIIGISTHSIEQAIEADSEEQAIAGFLDRYFIQRQKMQVSRKASKC